MTQIDVVTVVLVHWNQAARCVATVEAFDVDMVIVDNGSSPDQLEVLHAIGAVTVIELGRNTGFGPGANAGWRHWLDGGKGEWCVVAPHDALPAPDCLSLMFDALETRPRAGLACADVGDGQTPVIDEYFGGMTSPARVEEGWEPAGYPHGTLLVARRSCLGDIGLFDERYFAYCEEADLGERARRAGWEVGIVRGARVVNPYLGGGSDIVDYLMLRNTLLLVRKHFVPGHHPFPDRAHAPGARHDRSVEPALDLRSRRSGSCTRRLRSRTLRSAAGDADPWCDYSGSGSIDSTVQNARSDAIDASSLNVRWSMMRGIRLRVSPLPACA